MEAGSAHSCHGLKFTGFPQLCEHAPFRTGDRLIAQPDVAAIVKSVRSPLSVRWDVPSPAATVTAISLSSADVVDRSSVAITDCPRITTARGYPQLTTLSPKHGSPATPSLRSRGRSRGGGTYC